MLYLYDDALTMTHALRDYDAIIERQQMFEPSTLDVKCHDYAAITAATYCAIGAELYRIERVALDKTEVRVEARSALVDLECRVLSAPLDFTGTTGAFIESILNGLTGPRATNLTAGNMPTVASALRRIEAGTTVYQAIRSLASAEGMGLTTRMVGTTCFVDLVIPAVSAIEMGDALRNITRSTRETDEIGWRNYAVVVGEHGGAPVTVTVDQTSGGERREQYVAVPPDNAGLTLAAYQSVLAAEGAAALADARRVDYVDAQTEAPVGLGDVVWYDGGSWSGWLLCAARTTTLERGTTVVATLGEPPASIRKTLRRIR